MRIELTAWFWGGAQTLQLLCLGFNRNVAQLSVGLPYTTCHKEQTKPHIDLPQYYSSCQMKAV